MFWILAVLLSLAAADTPNKDGKCKQKLANQYDYIIVGAGTAGCVLANRLSEHPFHNVLLIEAGGSDRDRPETTLIDTPALVADLWNSDVSWRYSSEPQSSAGFGLNGNRLNLPRGKVIGGTMAINTMVYQRGSPEIYNQWAKKGAHGWSYNEVEQYFERMEDVRLNEPYNKAKRGTCGPMRVSQNKITIFRDLFGNASLALGYKRMSCNEGVDEGFCALQINTKSGERWNTAKAYLAPVMGRKNLHVLTDTTVAKVLLYQGTAVGVEFRSSEGKTKRVFTRKEVIISAGVFNTPKLLLLSGIGPREHLKQLEIPVMSNVPVGLDLKELPVVPLRIFLNIPSFTPELLVRPEHTLAYITNRTGLLSEVSPKEGLLFAKTSLDTPDWPDINLYFISTLFDRLPEILRSWNIKENLINTWFREGLGREGIQIMAQLIHPLSRGRVTLKSDDPMDPPLIDPGFLTDIRDVRELIKAVRLINELVNTEYLKKAGATMDAPFPECNQFTFNTTDYWECYIRYFAIANFHGTGTVKMGSVKDNAAVLDPELRVKGIHGLRVVGSSAMPEPTEDQTAAVIMMAERASDLIKLAAGVPVGDVPMIPRRMPRNNPRLPRPSGPPRNQHRPHNLPMKNAPVVIQEDGHLSTPLSQHVEPQNTPPSPSGALISSSNQQSPIDHTSLHKPLGPLTL
ncbi:glucose dehydrogenase [FAD, quinone]-like [Mizuhopecten yessoensis]|uniref:Glucose dehydrogenase [acceptor] n=1 Tax=Mizuhopecten yessoensis TaxID=6573 RepID=A0A210Q0V8_MIZYE|nr:glucose dehydrogenase [FAD, quinone]-like [Mizuhopecten yessoensis]OWF42345.1 Glucose dehydrogenase [acceptor] [Mizuhopecten yessoensis]